MWWQQCGAVIYTYVCVLQLDTASEALAQLMSSELDAASRQQAPESVEISKKERRKRGHKALSIAEKEARLEAAYRARENAGISAEKEAQLEAVRSAEKETRYEAAYRARSNTTKRQTGHEESKRLVTERRKREEQLQHGIQEQRKVEQEHDSSVLLARAGQEAQHRERKWRESMEAQQREGERRDPNIHQEKEARIEKERVQRTELEAAQWLAAIEAKVKREIAEENERPERESEDRRNKDEKHRKEVQRVVKTQEPGQAGGVNKRRWQEGDDRSTQLAPEHREQEEQGEQGDPEADILEARPSCGSHSVDRAG